MQTTIAPSEPAMDICSGPEGVSASARTPPAQKVAGDESNVAARAEASVLAISELTPDLRRQARVMEREVYPEVPETRPPPLRIQGRRGRGDGSEFLGSRWTGEGEGS